MSSVVVCKLNVLRLEQMFKSFKSSWNVCAANLGSLSEIILLGNPNLLKRLSHRSMVAPSQVNVLAQGHKITPFERPWSTMTRIELYPSTGGRSVIRYMEQWAKGLVVFAPSITDKPGSMAIV